VLPRGEQRQWEPRCRVFHLDDVLVAGSHSCVPRMLRKKPINDVPLRTDLPPSSPKCAVERARERHLGIPRLLEDYAAEGLTLCQTCLVAGATEGR